MFVGWCFIYVICIYLRILVSGTVFILDNVRVDQQSHDGCPCRAEIVYNSISPEFTTCFEWGSCCSIFYSLLSVKNTRLNYEWMSKISSYVVVIYVVNINFKFLHLTHMSWRLDRCFTIRVQIIIHMLIYPNRITIFCPMKMLDKRIYIFIIVLIIYCLKYVSSVVRSQ